MAGHFLWVLVWTGACYWHGVGGFMFNSPSSEQHTKYQKYYATRLSARWGARTRNLARGPGLYKTLSPEHFRGLVKRRKKVPGRARVRGEDQRAAVQSGRCSRRRQSSSRRTRLPPALISQADELALIVEGVEPISVVRARRGALPHSCGRRRQRVLRPQQAELHTAPSGGTRRVTVASWWLVTGEMLWCETVVPSDGPALAPSGGSGA